MNFFEQELRKLLAKGIAPKSAKVTYIGRTCYLKLSGDRRARLCLLYTSPSPRDS